MIANQIDARTRPRSPSGGDSGESNPYTPSAARRVTLRDVLIAAVYYKRIGILFALIPIVIGIIAAMETRTSYTASGMLMVLVTREQAGNQGLTDTGPAVLSIEGLNAVKAEVSIIGSAEVIRSTIDEITPAVLFPDTVAWWAPIVSFLKVGDEKELESKLVERFRKQLDVRMQPDSNIIRVSFSDPDRALAIRVTDLLIQNYLAYRRKLYENPRSVLLAEHVKLLSGQLADKEQQLQDTKAAANVIDIDQDRLLAANQVDNIIQRVRQVRERREAVTGQLAAARQQLGEIDKTVFDFSQTANSVSGDDAGNLLTRLRAERQNMLSKFAPGHPSIQAIDRQIAAVRDSIENPEDKISWSNRQIRNPSLAFLSNRILDLGNEQQALDRQLLELDAQREIAEKRISELREADRLLTRQAREHEVLGTAYSEYVRRAEAARIEEEAEALRLSNVRLVQSAKDDVTDRSMALPFLVAGLFGGILFGGAAIACATALRSTLISPDEAERITRLPLLAVFSNKDTDFTKAHRGETISALVTRLFDLQVRDRSLSTLMLVDVGAPEDRRCLVSAITHELCINRQQQVLLIEVPPLNGSQSSRSAGAGTVLNAASDVTPALAGLGMNIVQGPMAGLHVAQATGPSLLGDQRSLGANLRSVLEDLQQQYPAILLSVNAQDNVPLTQYLSATVDASLLILRAETSRSPAAIWLRDLLLNAGGGIAGFVFTGRKFYLSERVYRWL